MPPVKKPTPTSLDELSPEDRAQLEAQVAEKLRADTTSRLAIESDRRIELLRELLEERDHARGCPMDGRVEASGATRPARPQRGEPAKDVTVVRCVECGGQTVLDRAYEDVLAELNRELAEREPEPIT